MRLLLVALLLLVPLPAFADFDVSHRSICIGSKVTSAGTPPDILYYRSRRLSPDRVVVGYFVVFSEERPWGNNWMTWTILPALVVDAVYSHTLFIAPGVQRVMYGRGDVEGAAVFYRENGGELEVTSALADDGAHRPVALTREEVLAVDAQRPVLYGDGWSHQLGGRGAHAPTDLAWLRCYEGDTIQPLTSELDAHYALANRAAPAHVERLVSVTGYASRR